MHQSFSKMGGGVAVFDYDNDGWEDLYMTGGIGTDKLYRNQGNGQFQDVSVAAGIESETSGHDTFGVISGDVDNDGHRDIVVTTFFNSESLLFHNQGDGTFNLLPNAINDDENWKTAASFGDVNKDGLLDLYLTSYIFTSGFIYDSLGQVVGFDHDCDPNQFYINNGDLTFTEATATYGLNDEGCALGVAFSDYDNDTDMDIVLSNDFGQYVVPNTVFQNQYPSATFQDLGTPLNMDDGMYGMGVAVGDYDRDGDLDYYQTNIGRNRLSRNDGSVFSDQTTFANVENDSLNGLNTTSWGCMFFDADNDAWPDLFVANGEISAAQFIANVYYDPNKLYHNNTNGTFTDISASAGIDGHLKGRGSAYADFDKDGKLDLVVVNVDADPDSAQVEYYHNITSTNYNWIAYSLEGVQSNRDAFGSHVRVVLNGVSTLAEVDGGSSHISQNSSILHFGLGELTVVDSVIVTFPSGIERVFVNPAINQVHDVLEDISISISDHLDQLKVRILETQLEIQSTMNGPAVLSIFDLTGKLILTRKIGVRAGVQRVSLPEEIAAGSYLVSLDLGGFPATDRWIKQWSSH